eukprot:424968-Rhodomonas_salina.2
MGRCEEELSNALLESGARGAGGSGSATGDGVDRRSPMTKCCHVGPEGVSEWEEGKGKISRIWSE